MALSVNSSCSALGAGSDASDGGPGSGSGAGAVGLGVQGGEDGSRGGEGDRSGRVRRISVNMGVMSTGDRLGEGDGGIDGGGVDDGSVNGGSDNGDDVSYERGDTRRLESSSLSLTNSTSRRLFQVHLAGGYLSSGDSAVGSMSTGWVLSFVAQAETVVEGSIGHSVGVGACGCLLQSFASENGRRALHPSSQ
jgi:hypothetical protein